MNEGSYVIVTRVKGRVHVYGPYLNRHSAQADMRRMKRADCDMYGDDGELVLSVHRVLSEPPPD